MKSKLLLLASALISLNAFAQKKNVMTSVVYGPMLGYITYSEAHVWAQFEGLNIPVLQYWDIADPKNKRTAHSHKLSSERAIYDFVCEVQPGKTYQYRLNLSLIPKKEDSLLRFTTPALWRWRTDPPQIRFAMGSCNYTNQPEHDRPGKAYGDTSTDIFNRIADRKPDFMLWLGDNTYLREPDWGSRSGIYNRYEHTRKNSALQRLLSTCPHYAVWDDHDFGPNDANGSYAFKEQTLDVFKQYWPNPYLNRSDMPGVTSWFEYGDAQFFMLDNRFHRVAHAADSTEKTILGRIQLDWLKQALATAPADEFKFVVMGGQFLNTARVHETYSNWAAERQEILDWIRQKKIRNVVFLTGDRHHAELSVMKQNGMPTVYDFTSSPLTAGLANTKPEEPNRWRVEGTFNNKERNFGMVEITGPRKDRTIRFVLYDKFGGAIWTHEFKAEKN